MVMQLNILVTLKKMSKKKKLTKCHTQFLVIHKFWSFKIQKSSEERILCSEFLPKIADFFSPSDDDCWILNNQKL